MGPKISVRRGVDIEWTPEKLLPPKYIECVYESVKKRKGKREKGKRKKGKRKKKHLETRHYY